MAEPFDTCWARITRADAHNKAVAKAWNAFIEEDTEAYEPVLNIEPDGTGRLWVYQVKPIPSSISFGVGEFLYQLRAALDASIYELACVNGKKRPPAKESALEFPICSSPRSFEDSRWKIEPLTEEQRAIVESVQPYKAPPDLEPRYIPYNFNRTLGILHDWARIDRHRRLHVAGSWADNLEPMFVVPKGTTLVDLEILEPGFLLENEREVARFRINGWKPGMNVYANPNLTFDIGLDEVPPPCHESDTLGKRFKGMLITVTSVVAGLAKTVGIDFKKSG